MLRLESYCILLTGLFAILFSRTVHAQQSFHLNTAERMNTEITSCIQKDSKDNMWVASYNGLFKHEGVRIRSFNHIGHGSQAISGNEMHTILEDHLGYIWTGTSNRLDKIDPFTYEIKHFPLHSTDSSSSFTGYIYALFQDEEHFIWISTDAGLLRMNYATGEYVSIPQSNDEKGMPSYSISYKGGVSTKKGLWIHTGTGMVYYEYSTRKFYHRYYNPANKDIFKICQTGSGNQSDLKKDHQGNLWFINNNSTLVRFNTGTEKIDSFQFTFPVNAWRCCYSITIDKKDNVWLGFRHGGLLVLDQATGSFTAIKANDGSGLLNNDYIGSLETDYRGDVWVSTGNGIDIIDLYDSSVRKLQLRPTPDFTDLVYQQATITTDGHSFVYIPFYKYGFLQVDLATDSILYFNAGDNKSHGTTYVLDKNDTRGEVLIARSGKLLPYNLAAKKLQTQTGPVIPDSIKLDGDIVWFHSTDSSVILKTNRGGIHYFTRSGYYEKMEGVGFKKPICIDDDKKSCWYISWDIQLVRKDLQTRIADTFNIQSQLKRMDFSFANPRDMTDDGQNIWISGQYGLLRFEKKTNTLYAYTPENGLSHSFTFALCTDRNKNLWVGSLSGVDVYDRTNNVFRSVASQPAGSYMSAFGGVVRVNDGRLYFALGNNLYIINPDAGLPRRSSGKLFQLSIQEVLVNGKALNWNTGKLRTLQHHENRILIRYGLLNFTKQSDVKYFYYLEGSDKNWIENISPGELSYNGLAPDHYILHLKAVDRAGKLLADELSIPITISPPWWQTFWFRAVVVLIFCTALYLLYRRRIKAIHAKAAIKQQMTELEGKALRAQMNPHFIFNSLNAIQELIVTKNIDEGYQYLSQFSKLLRMVLNNSEKNVIPLSSEIEMIRLQLSLESLRFKRSFNYHIDTEKNIEPELISVPPLLLQPYVENAVWHGLRNKEGKKNLWIRIKENDGKLNISIEDDGIGRQKAEEIRKQKLGAEQFESKGSMLSQQRIKILDELYPAGATVTVVDMKNEQGEATGTTIKISLPINLG